MDVLQRTFLLDLTNQTKINREIHGSTQYISIEIKFRRLSRRILGHHRIHQQDPKLLQINIILADKNVDLVWFIKYIQEVGKYKISTW